jgi:hypothetical protein
MMIKENGTTADLVIPSGTHHIYAYYIEDAGDNAPRRFLSVTSPFTESRRAIDTTLTGDVGFFVRTGDDPPTSIVAADTVNGATTDLCFLGAVTNTAGTITCTGYNATTAPNGAYATNRLSSPLAAIATPPQVATQSGSIATIVGMLRALAYQLGLLIWKNSQNVTPGAGNNFGAWDTVPVGIDGLFNPANEAQQTAIVRLKDWQGNIRATFDHNGYPAGDYTQVIDNWEEGGLFSKNVPITTGWSSAGVLNTDYSRDDGLIDFLTTVAVWHTTLFGIPPGATLQSIFVNHNDDVNGDNYSALVTVTTPGLSIATVHRTIPTNIGYVGHDIFVSPDVGSGPMVVAEGTFIDVQLFLASSTALQNYRVYDFVIKFTTDPPGWTWTGVTGSNNPTGDQRNYLDPPTGISTFSQRTLQLVSSSFLAGPDGLSVLQQSVSDHKLTGYTVWVQEFDVDFATLIDGPNACVVDIGTRFDTTFITLHWDHTLTNWQLRSKVGGTPTDVDTGVAAANGTVHRVRLEVLGGLVNSTGNTKSNLYIDGVLVATQNHNYFSTSFHLVAYYAVGTDAAGAASGPYDVRIAPVRRTWNHLKAGDNL